MSNIANKILVVDTDLAFLAEIKAELGDEYQVEISSSSEKALERFKDFKPNVVILDTSLSDISFTELLGRFRQSDRNVIRIALSKDLDNVEPLIEAINVAHIHNYFLKPVNFPKLKTALQSKVMDYHVVKRGDVDAAYKKLDTILDMVKKADKIREQAEIQLAKAGDMEAECLRKIHGYNQSLESAEKRYKALEAETQRLKGQCVELEALKKRDIDGMERERDKLRNEIEQQKERYDKLSEEKEKLSDSMKEIEFAMESEQKATMSISPDFKVTNRKKKNDRDSMMVVDDESDIRELFEACFGEIFNVYTADGAKNALETLEANPDICLIVTDQMMPQVTGLELAEQIHKKHSSIPIYLLTGQADLHTAIMAMNAGNIIKYFEKPFEPTELEKELRKGFELFDSNMAQLEILTEKKAFVVDQIKDLSFERKTLKHQNSKLTEETTKLKAENEQLRGSVAKERDKMLSEIRAVQKEREDSLRKKMEEAENVITVQKEKNKKELEELSRTFEVEKEKARKEVEERRVAAQKELEEAKKAVEVQRLAMQKEMDEVNKSIETQRLAMEKEIAKAKEDAAAERGLLTAKFEEEKARFEADLAAKKHALEEEIKRIDTLAAARKEELEKKLQQEIEQKRAEAQAEMEQLKATVTKDYDRLKSEMARAEQQTKELMAKAAAAIQDRDLKIGHLEEQVTSMQSEHDLAIRSREALVSEISELRSRM